MKWYCTLHCQESNHQVCGLEPRFTFQRIRFFFIGFGTPKGNRTPIYTLKGCRPMPFSRWEHINCPTNNTLVCSLTLSWYYLKWAGMWFSSLVGLESSLESLQIKIVQLLPFHMPLCSGVWCCGQSTSTSHLNGRGVQPLSVKVVAHLLDVTASSP